MKRAMSGVLATIILVSLTACMIVPPRAEYIGPRIDFPAPYPIYRQPYYGEPWRHSHEPHGRGARW